MEQVVRLTNEAIAEAILAGWRHVITKDLGGITAKMMGEAVGRNTCYYVESAVLAGLDQLRIQNVPLEIRSTPIEAAIAVLKSSWIIQDSDKRTRSENWALDRLNAESSAGAEQLLQFWISAIDSGATHIESLTRIRELKSEGSVVADALYSLLDCRRSMPVNLLRVVLRAAVKRVAPKLLLTLAEKAIADITVEDEQRQIWIFLAFALDPQTYGPRMLSEHSADGGTHLYEALRSHEIDPIETILPKARSERDSVIIRLVGSKESPNDDAWETSTKVDVIRHAIRSLESYPEDEAGKAIQSLMTDPALLEWERNLKHAYAQWNHVHRDRSFTYPSPQDIMGAINSGPPVNAADLLAVVIDVLEGLRRELRSSDVTPWKHYWNRVGGEVQEPLIENQCRNHLLERLRDRILPYNITAAIPEAQRWTCLFLAVQASRYR